MINAQELIEAAKDVKSGADLVRDYWSSTESGKKTLKTMDLVSDYILNNVKEDDNEEQGDIKVVLPDYKGEISVSEHGMMLKTVDSYGWVHFMRTRPTRKQFRDLCKGLGINNVNN